MSQDESFERTRKSRAFQEGQQFGKAILRTVELFYQRQTRKRYLVGLISTLNVGYGISELLHDKKAMESLSSKTIEILDKFEANQKQPKKYRHIWLTVEGSKNVCCCRCGSSFEDAGIKCIPKDEVKVKK